MLPSGNQEDAGLEQPARQPPQSPRMARSTLERKCSENPGEEKQSEDKPAIRHLDVDPDPAPPPTQLTDPLERDAASRPRTPSANTTGAIRNLT